MSSVDSQLQRICMQPVHLRTNVNAKSAHAYPLLACTCPMCLMCSSSTLSEDAVQTYAAFMEDSGFKTPASLDWPLFLSVFGPMYTKAVQAGRFKALTAYENSVFPILMQLEHDREFAAASNV